MPRAFGLSLAFDTPPPGAWREAEIDGPDLRVKSANREEIEAVWSGREEIGWEAPIDGAPFSVERGQADDYLFKHGDRSLHHLSVDQATLLRAPGDDGPVGWRITLDSVLFSVALIRGFEAVHAGAVATETGAVAIAAGAGGGKSTLLAELMRGDYTLLTDDVVVLESLAGGPPLAHPGAPLMTVPVSLGQMPGESIATLGDESWQAVATSGEAIPLTAMIVLNRRPGLETALLEVENPLAVLMASLLHFPRSPDRERARFELAGTIASHVPVLELRADPAVDPSTLAAVLRLSEERGELNRH